MSEAEGFEMVESPGLGSDWVPEYRAYSCSQQDTTCLFSLAAPAQGERARSPLVLSAVLDRSGSMRGDKIALLRDTVKFVIRQLGQRDHAGILAFDSQVSTISKIEQMTTDAKSRCSQKVDEIRVQGLTNLSGALFKSLEDQVAHMRTGAAQPLNPDSDEPLTYTMDSAPNDAGERAAIHSIFLLTDGRPTAGITEPESILSTLANLRGQTREMADTVVHTFGFGSDHDDNLMAQIADHGKGSYFYIEGPEQLPAAFATALGGLLTVVAQNIRISLSGLDGAVLRGVRTTFRKTTEGGCTVVHVPDMYAEENRDILLDVALPAVPTAGDYPTLKASVSYIDIVTQRAVTRECVFCARRAAGDLGRDRNADERIVMHNMRYETAQAMEAADEAARTGRISNAMHRLRVAHERVDSARATMPDSSATARLSLQALSDDLHLCMSSSRSTADYTLHGSKNLKRLQRSHASQRATAVSSAMYERAGSAVLPQPWGPQAPGSAAAFSPASDLILPGGAPSAPLAGPEPQPPQSGFGRFGFWSPRRSPRAQAPSIAQPVQAAAHVSAVVPPARGLTRASTYQTTTQGALVEEASTSILGDDSV